jgi:hypothetical protein
LAEKRWKSCSPIRTCIGSWGQHAPAGARGAVTLVQFINRHDTSLHRISRTPNRAFKGKTHSTSHHYWEILYVYANDAQG